MICVFSLVLLVNYFMILDIQLFSAMRQFKISCQQDAFSNTVLQQHFLYYIKDISNPPPAGGRQKIGKLWCSPSILGLLDQRINNK